MCRVSSSVAPACFSAECHQDRALPWSNLNHHQKHAVSAWPLWVRPDHLGAPVRRPTWQHLDVLQHSWASVSMFAMCLSRSRGWVGVRLRPVDWLPATPGEGGMGLGTWGRIPLPCRFAEPASCRGPENVLWRPRLKGQRLLGSGPIPTFTPLKSAPAVKLQLSWEHRSPAL